MYAIVFDPRWGSGRWCLICSQYCLSCFYFLLVVIQEVILLAYSLGCPCLFAILCAYLILSMATSVYFEACCVKLYLSDILVVTLVTIHIVNICLTIKSVLQMFICCYTISIHLNSRSRQVNINDIFIRTFRIYGCQKHLFWLQISYWQRNYASQTKISISLNMCPC